MIDHANLSIFITVALLPIAWLLDCVLGEANRYHPLVGYGKYVRKIERIIYTADSSDRYQGILSLLLALAPVIPFSFLAYYLNDGLYLLLSIIAIYIAMSYRGLREHAMDVQNALEKSDIILARKNLAKIVSRDTSDLSETEVTSACVESILENGNDAIFAAWFWWLVAGLPGVMLYRMVNTLDAMWGYKNKKYFYFGWAAARLDDVFNYIPARTTALCYCLAGDAKNAWNCWRQQGKYWKSPNAGPVMASGAGSLSLKLGGPANYDGLQQNRPALGVGEAAELQDISRAVQLIRKALWIWLVLASLVIFVFVSLVNLI